MIPRAEFDQSIDIDPTRDYGASAERVIHGIPCVHDYEPHFFLEATWEGAEQTLRTERDAVAELDAKCDDEDSFAEAAWEEGRELFLAFELGVSGLAEALCAAGCPTFSSCSGHPDDGTHRSAHPWIVCACDRDRLHLLLEAVQATGCSADAEASGHLGLLAPSVVESIALGFELLASRFHFDAVPPAIDREELRAIAEDWGEEWEE
jgi:hypothetical protein